MKNGSRPSDSRDSCQLEQEHRNDRADRDRQVAGDRARRVGDDGLHATHVVGQSALDLAGFRLGEEAQRHALEVRVERSPQVLHDVLADDVVEVALPDADQPREDRQHDHQPDVEVQLLVVAADDDLVEEDTQQQRVHEADQAGQQDRDQHDEDVGPIRTEEGEDPADRRAAPLRRHRDELLGGAAPHAPAHRPGPAPAATTPAAPPVATRVRPRGNAIRSCSPSDRR